MKTMYICKYFIFEYDQFMPIKLMFTTTQGIVLQGNEKKYPISISREGIKHFLILPLPTLNSTIFV